jgi:hypothetical protein
VGNCYRFVVAIPAPIMRKFTHFIRLHLPHIFLLTDRKSIYYANCPLKAICLRVYFVEDSLDMH